MDKDDVMLNPLKRFFSKAHVQGLSCFTSTDVDSRNPESAGFRVISMIFEHHSPVSPVDGADSLPNIARLKVQRKRDRLRVCELAVPFPLDSLRKKHTGLNVMCAEIR